MASHPTQQNSLRINQLQQVFESLFLRSENTQLKFGADEPFYQAATENTKATIFCREDFFSSALHEIAHWCIAGKERRAIDDFGYWYNPEGRTAEEQTMFEQVEVKPQAIEWALSLATDQPFHFSADNLSQNIDASAEFKQKVTEQLEDYLCEQLPPRAQKLFDALNKAFRNNKAVSYYV